MLKCRECKECNGLACRGEIPGLGGKDSGRAFINNVEALKSVRINMDVCAEPGEITTETEILGIPMSMPVFSAPVAGIKNNYGYDIGEYEYSQLMLQGCADAGIIGFTGDGIDPEELFAKPARAIHDLGGRGIATIKPWVKEGVDLRIGILKDLNTVGNLDLDKPWWDPYCKEECTFGKSVYFMTGDLSINDNRATYCIYFNKNLAEQYQLPNFYDEVKNHTWTIDRFRSFAEALPTDLDTDDDGKHVNDTDDAYAIWIWDDIMMGIVNASGVKCATIQQDGSLTLTLNCEQLYNTFDKFAAYAFDTGITCEYQRSGYDQEYGQIGFREGRALFLMSYLYDATALRDMEDDFGILPMMLYDETQDRYCNSVSSYPSSFYVIPICSFSEEEYDRTGYVTQMLAYKSLMTMTPAYYEQTLQGKVSRDEESSSMLDLIFATRSYDFGWYFEIGGYTGVMMDALRNYDLNLASNIKAYEKMASKLLDKYNKKIAELGN